MDRTEISGIKLDELQEKINCQCANILALLYLMREDDSVEWNSQYGWDLVKLRDDIKPIFTRSLQTLNIVEISKLHVDYNFYISKHQCTLLDVYTYQRTAHLTAGVS